MPLVIDNCLYKSSDFLIKILEPEDVEEATQCILHNFLSGEPMCSALQLTEDDFELFIRLFTEKSAKEELSVIARHPVTNKFMGCIISEDMATEAPEGIENMSEKALPIVSLLEELDAEFLSKNPPIPGEFFHMLLCGVYKEFSGLQLTHLLTQESEKLAKERGYKLALIEATGPASQYVVKEKMGYKQQEALTYKTFSYNGSYPFASISNCESCLLLSKVL
jgi:hypothetical protein